MLAPSLLLPSASAQVPTPEPETALCFEADPRPPSVTPANPTPGARGDHCPGGDPPTPNFRQGDPVNVRLENFRRETSGISAPWIRIRCLTGCIDDPDGSRLYWARWDGTRAHLSFPRDFREEGEDGMGRDAVADKAPRSNGTWEVRAYLDTGPVTRTFNVWLFSLHRSRNLTVAPGEEHEFISSGIPVNSTVDFRIERRAATGYVPIPLATPPTRPDGAGNFRYIWNVPLNETGRAADCPTSVTHCYRAIVRPSTGKPEEIVPFRVGPADIRITTSSGTDPGGTPQTKERTDVVTVFATFHYPGGRLNNGPAITPDKLTPPPPGEERTIRLRVERTNLTAPTQPAVGVADIDLRYSTRNFRWEGSWTIPRDLDVSSGSRYRVQLPETFDQWGNRIPPRILANYTIERATLEPVVAHANATLERTSEGLVRVAVRYHNGTPLGDADVTRPLLGCFRRVDSPIPCANSTAAGVQQGEYAGGTWLFRKTYPRDYANLGLHEFVLLGGAESEDRWGNRVNGTTSPPIDVVPASPRIEFSTVMRGRSVTTLERGESIQVLATITYADGRPYNHTVRVNDKLDESHFLTVNVTKRGADLHSVVPLLLEEADTETGLWQGTQQLTLDDAQTPVGTWTFELDVRDNLTAPNVNRTTFDRSIVATPLRFRTERLLNPFPSTSGNANVVHTFRLSYPTGGEVTGAAVKDQGIVAQVYKYDARNRTHVGEPLSNLIYPQWDALDARGVWSLRYTVPNHLFNGPYVFYLKGQDASGNVLPADAYSTPFTPHSPVVSREVVTPPQTAVRRGEDATVVIAAQDGDVGTDGTGKPAISVERWNDGASRWDVAFGGANVRQSAVDPINHVGVFPITSTTPIGTYRFHFLGRDAKLQIVEVYSRNFTVLPTEVTRAVIIPPPEAMTKGHTVTMLIEYRSGDRILNVTVLERLRPTTLPAPSSYIQGDRLNVSWTIPVEAPNGNYTIRFRGLDQYGNEILIDSPPVEARPAQLAGKVLGNPPRVIERGFSATMLFGVTYPDGSYYANMNVPKVFVYNTTGLAGSAEVKLRGVTYEASWSAPQTAGEGDYWFETAGEANAGNNFPILRSSTFRLAPGQFERAGAASVAGAFERFNTVTWAAPIEAGDSGIVFRIAYYGAGSDLTTALADKSPLLSTTLPHAVDTTSGRYTTRWVTDEVTPVGVYRFVMEGKDALGNDVVARSNPFTLQSVPIIVEMKSQPATEEFTEGASLTYTFTLRYKNGPLVEQRLGRPAVQMLIEGFPTSQPANVAFENGVWVATWQAPATLAPGTYVLVVSGFDNGGNPIARHTTLPHVWTTSLSESFAKRVPGAPVPVLLLGLAAVALALSRRRSA